MERGPNRGRGACAPRRRLFHSCLIAWALAIFAAAVVLPAGPAHAEITVRSGIFTDEGYGRLVLTFERMPTYEVRATAGVIVLVFSEQVAIDINKLPQQMDDYITAARLDPDGMALRLALAGKMTLNTMQAGEQLFLDFLPAGWVGLPPGLPEDVVADLARRAEEAKRKLREDALREAGLLDIPPVQLEVGQYPTFSRLSFVWDRNIDAELTRDGEDITIRFPIRGQLDLGPLKGSPPRLVLGADQVTEDGRLEIRLRVSRSASVRAFAEERTYVVDVGGGAEVFAGEALLDSLARERAKAEEDGGDEDGPSPAQRPIVATELGAAKEPVPPEPPTAEPEPAPTVETRIQAFDPSSLGGGDFADAQGGTFKPDGNVSPQDTGNESENGGKPGIGKGDVRVGDLGGAGAQGAEDGGSEAGAGKDGAGAVKMRAVRIGDSVRMTFPFTEPVAASTFAREDTVWIVFDTDRRIDIAALRDFLHDRLADVKLHRQDGFQYLQLKLARPSLTSVAVEAARWVVTLGETPLEPTRPLVLRRDYAMDGAQIVRVDMADTGRVHWIPDPDAGDNLAVVTAMGPARGLIKPQDFVKFGALVSAHGLAFKPVSDDLSVELDKRGVTIRGAKGGLWLSSSARPEFGHGDGVLMTEQRPGFINIAGIRHAGQAKFEAVRQQLEQLAAMAPPAERMVQRLTLGRFLVGYGLAGEALGVLDHLTNNDPQAVRDPVFAAIRGIANVMMHRPAEALKDLDHPALAQSSDALLWRGMAQVQKRNWRAAMTAFREGEKVFTDYPAALQVDFRLAAVRAALEMKDLDEAAHHLDALEPYLARGAENEPALPARVTFLRARFKEAAGRSEDALAGYKAGIESWVRPVEAESRLRHTALLHRLGRITVDQAIDALETLNVIWRGDAIELEAHKMLARMHLAKGEYRRAFELMRMAMAVDAESDIARYIQDEMAIAFQDLFLHGKSSNMDPIEALSLYYDYRDLTPIGRLGDEMIRKLSDRLIDVDLLDQAAELLGYQMDNRLTGAARSLVAVRLAYVHLLNRRPAEALNAINRTRHAGLPAETQRQRNLLEARALSELGRSELALELLDSMQGDDIAEVRADTLWRAQSWQEAAEEIERNLGKGWSNGEALGEKDRFNVMRAAVAYALAGDQLGLDRMRDKFAVKMAGSPDANAFAVVTRTATTGQAAFEALAQGITASDTLDAFLAEFREKYTKPGAQGLNMPAGGDAGTESAPRG